MATNLTNCAGSTEQLQAQHVGAHPVCSGAFDLNGYISFYSGHSKSMRLKHIADTFPPLCDEALSMLAQTLETNGNLKEYEDLVSGPHKPRMAKLSLDRAGWVDERRRSSNVTIGKLELALRESGDDHAAARAAYIDLGDIYYSIGELVSAKKDWYQHALEHGCSLEVDATQYREWCLKLVKCCVNSPGTPFSMNDHLTKAKGGAGAMVSSMLEASKGLSHLIQASRSLKGSLSSSHDNSLKSAALCFCNTTVDMDYRFSEVLVPQDVAAYGGLCALATMERDQLKRHVMQSRSFSKTLSLAPLVQSIVGDFFNSRYTAMIESLNLLRPVLELDCFFSGAVNRVFNAISTRAMVQFVSPYARVRLPEMASTFQMDQKALDSELRELILAKRIQARIDARHGCLIANMETPRTNAFDRAVEAGDEVEDALVKMLLTKSVLKDDLTPTDPRNERSHAAAMMNMVQGMMM